MAFLHRLAVDLEHAEVDLVNVEDVVLRSAILDGPIFHRALVHHDVRRLAHAIGLPASARKR